MTRARRCEVFDADTVGVYHCFNRIVRRSYLCGFDPRTGIDYSHRREWLYQRLKSLAKHFAIDVLGYAILSNHYHLILRNRPDLVQRMSDEQVVRAWLKICPSRGQRCRGLSRDPNDAEIHAEQSRANRVQELRMRLSNPSWLIRQLSQYMGIRCNAEDQIRGHFWESRFGMRRLLDEAAVLACLAYVDLNPVRASMVGSIEDYPHVSIGERLRALDDDAVDTSSWLAPLELAGQCDGTSVTVVNRLSRKQLAEILDNSSSTELGSLPMKLEDYAELLRWLASQHRGDGTTALCRVPSILTKLKLDPVGFSSSANQFGRRFSTAAGCPASLAIEAERRGRLRIHGLGKRSQDHCRGSDSTVSTAPPTPR